MHERGWDGRREGTDRGSAQICRSFDADGEAIGDAESRPQMPRRRRGNIAYGLRKNNFGFVKTISDKTDTDSFVIQFDIPVRETISFTLNVSTAFHRGCNTI